MTPAQLDFYREQLDRCWHWLEPAVAVYGATHSKGDVWKAIEAGTAQLWPLKNGAIVTEFNIHPTGLSELSFWLAGGDLAELTAIEPQIAAFGEQYGCDRIVITGRRGWVKALPNYQEVATIMVKEFRR